MCFLTRKTLCTSRGREKVSSAAADAVPASSAAAAVLVGIVELLASAADASMSGPHTYREGGTTTR